MNSRVHNFIWHPLIRGTVTTIFWGALIIGALLLVNAACSAAGIEFCDPIAPQEVCS